MTFCGHSSVLVALLFIGSMAAFRATCGPLTVLDLSVGAAATLAWIVQEWVIHRYLLHSPFNWLGKQIHEEHHRQPYHHVSIDGPEVVGGFMLLAACVSFAAIRPWGGPGLAATACILYFATGLISYQLVHMLVHTRWVPKNEFMRRVRRRHMLHHLRNHDNWFAFSLPVMDDWCGTAPEPGKVPLVSMVPLVSKTPSIQA